MRARFAGLSVGMRLACLNGQKPDGRSGRFPDPGEENPDADTKKGRYDIGPFCSER